MESRIQTLKPLIAPSLLAADFGCLAREVEAAERAGADALHFDIMDGHFVPNITFGPMVVRAVRPFSRLPFLVHLMIERPENFIDEFARAGANSIIVHAETCPHLHRTIEQIHAAGAKAGVALNPSTPPSAIEYVLGDIESVLVMTVNPGFGGQQFIESMIPKIRLVREMVGPVRAAGDSSANPGRDIVDIAVDGGIDEETAPRVFAAGANLFVAGTSVFGANDEMSRNIERLRLAARSARVCP